MNQEQALATLDRYIRARYGLIAIVSHEEARVMRAVEALAAKNNSEVITWSITEGLKGTDLKAVTDPTQAIKHLLETFNEQTTRRAVVVMKDLHNLLGDSSRGYNPVLMRSLRDAAARFRTLSVNIVFLSPAFSVPPDLSKEIALIDWPLPDNRDLDMILRRAEEGIRARNERENTRPYAITLNGNRGKLLDAMRGLTLNEAEAVLAAGIIATEGLGDNIIPHVINEKRQIIQKSGVLEFIETDVRMSSVGGLHDLKHYAEKKRRAFSPNARQAGVDAPRGVLLVGLPGTGKSLAAKAIAGGELPLLRMDVGALMQGLVGSSEANMRLALKTAEAVAPAVLWIDEIEKALGSAGGNLDGGTSARVFGTILTWMQETTAPVYVVATANNFESLDGALVRRFDDVYWVDLPNHDSRIEILSIHLVKRGQDPQRFDLETLAAEAWSFSGAELEKVVREAIETAFYTQSELTDRMLVEAAKSIVPLYESMGASLDRMRQQVPNARQAGAPLDRKPVPATEGINFSGL